MTRLAPGQPHDADGPVFSEPWEAQAFALAVALHERGVFRQDVYEHQLAPEPVGGRGRDERRTFGVGRAVDRAEDGSGRQCLVIDVVTDHDDRA